VTLGLNPGDLLSLQRVVLIVEGRHDELVIGQLLGDRLRDLGVDLDRMGGAKIGLSSIIESRLLFDYTDSVIVIVLDNDRARELNAVWDEARRLPASEARLVLERLDNRSEFRFFRDFATRCIAEGKQDRVHAYGLREPDILDYLPVESFVKTKKRRSWDGLRTEFGLVAAKDFKKWLSTQYGAAFDDQTVISAVAKMDAIPDDLIGLLRYCEQLPASDRAATG